MQSKCKGRSLASCHMWRRLSRVLCPPHRARDGTSTIVHPDVGTSVRGPRIPAQVRPGAHSTEQAPTSHSGARTPAIPRVAQCGQKISSVLEYSPHTPHKAVSDSSSSP